MSLSQQIITVLMCTGATMITRFLPFIIFSDKKKTPEIITFLGKWLPSAVFAMLVIYCIRDIDFKGGSYGAPELIGIFITALIHLWRKNLMLSMAVGTAAYMILMGLLG